MGEARGMAAEARSRPLPQPLPRPQLRDHHPPRPAPTSSSPSADTCRLCLFGAGGSATPRNTRLPSQRPPRAPAASPPPQPLLALKQGRSLGARGHPLPAPLRSSSRPHQASRCRPTLAVKFTAGRSGDGAGSLDGWGWWPGQSGVGTREGWGGTTPAPPPPPPLRLTAVGCPKQRSGSGAASRAKVGGSDQDPPSPQRPCTAGSGNSWWGHPGGTRGAAGAQLPPQFPGTSWGGDGGRSGEGVLN